MSFSLNYNHNILYDKKIEINLKQKAISKASLGNRFIDFSANTSNVVLQVKKLKSKQ